MNSMTSSAESEQSGLPPRLFIAESVRCRPPAFNQLRARQSMFISMLLGGRIVYTGKDIAAAHRQARAKGLNDGHYDRFLEHFRRALQEVGVQADKIGTVTKLLESKRRIILNPPGK